MSSVIGAPDRFGDDGERQRGLRQPVERTHDALDAELGNEPVEISVGEAIGVAIKQPLPLRLRCLAGRGRKVVDRGAGEGDQIAEQLAECASLLAVDGDCASGACREGVDAS